jgi:tetrahydromethanopterin S-methyltransferase subunit B
MSPEITVMGGELGNIFWDLPPWIVYAPGYDLGCTIYVANPTDTEKEYTLMSRLSSNETVISEEAVKVFGYAWFKVDPRDFIRLRGALRSDESDVVLSVLLVERETQEIADSVSRSLVAPAVSTLPPTWPGAPGTTGTTGFDWSLMLGMMFPIMMLGIVALAVKPGREREEALTVREERKLLPPGREE